MPIVFREFGPSLVNPWSSDFSNAFGPLGGVADTFLEWNTTVTRDFATPEDSTRLQMRDIAAHAAVAMNPRRDVVIPQELIGGATVTLNSASAIEWLKTLAVSSSVPQVEWRSTIASDATAFAEWRTALVLDSVIPDETKQTVAVAIGAIPVDFKLTPVLAYPVNVEWRAPVAADTTIPLDRVLSASMDFRVPMSMMSLLRRDDNSPIQFLPTIYRDDQITFESGNMPVAIIGDALIGIDWSGDIATDRTAPMEYRASLIRDMVVPSEWTGGVASFADAVMQISFGTGAMRIIPVPVETGSSVFSDPEVVTIADSMMVNELVPVSEFTLVVIGENFIFPTDAHTEKTTVGFTIPIEWSSTFVTADAEMFVSWVQEVRTDYECPVDWTSEISVDTKVLIESLTTPFDLFGDAEMAIEWRLSVLVDVVVETERWFDRDTIGAGLEPDEWELTHG